MSTLPSLASPDDLAAQLGRPLTASEATRAEVLLPQASAMVRRYTRQDFTLAADDEVVLRGQGDTIRVPQRPVVDVTRVVAVGGSDSLPDVPLTDWVWDGIDQIRLGGGNAVINLPEVWWDDDGYPNTYRVTYSHGYAETPDDVVGVVVGMVLTTLTAPTMAGGVTSETVGPYSYRLDQPGTGLAVSLTAGHKQILDDYRPKVGQIQVRRG